MRSVLAISAAWLTATLVAVVIAAAAVGNVRAQVTDGPTALGPPTTIEIEDESPTPPSQGEAPELDGDGQPPSSPPQSETPDLSVDAEPPSETTEPAPVTTSTSTTVVETTTTEPHPPESSATSTTDPAPTTSTTIAGYTKTYDVTIDGMTAGTVRIAVSGETVSFGGATVAPGWKFKLDEEGAHKVQVKFEAIEDDDIQFKFKAEIEDGELKVEISDGD